MSDPAAGFALDLHLDDAGFRQLVDFGLEDGASLVIDEPPPLGAGDGPNPARVLGAALGACLGASLLFCLRRARVDVRGLATRVEGTLTRNEHGRIRIAGFRVLLEPVVPVADQPRMARCLEVFEDFCVVTASVRPGIAVEVSVHPTAPAPVSRPAT